MHGFTTNLSITANAVAALQELAEAYLIGLHEDANLHCNHARWVMIMPTDIQCAIQI